MEPIYRVVRHKLYEKCNLKYEYFTIQIQVNVLWFKWWRTINGTDSHHEYSSTGNITFDNESDAISAIKKLQNGNIPDGWVSEVSTVLDFNKKK